MNEFGNLIINAESYEDALSKAGLNWEVTAEDTYFDYPDGIKRLIPTVKTIVRNTDKAPLGVVSDRYVIVNNKDAFELTEILFKDSDIEFIRGGEIKNIPQMGIRVSPPLKNAFNKLDLMFQTITTFSELTKYFTGEFEDLQNDEASIFYKNKKIYNQCVDYLKGVSKGLKEMFKICSHDLNQMNELLSNISNA